MSGARKVEYIKTAAANIDHRRCPEHDIHTCAPVVEYELKLPRAHSCTYRIHAFYLDSLLVFAGICAHNENIEDLI